VVLLLKGLRSHKVLVIRKYGGHEDLRGSGRRSVIPYVHGAAPGWAAGAGAAGHVAAPELPWAGQRELEPQDTWWPRSCLRLRSGSWSRRARGSPGAAPG
jgi:hypothetical protein